MLSSAKNILIELRERFKTTPTIYITIFLLGCVVFFNQDVPYTFMPVILLSSSIILFLSDYIINLSNVKKWIISILVYAFILQIYYFFLTTYNSFVENSTLSLMYLYLFFSINLYLSSSKNYILELKSKIIHILISFALFLATFLCLYFSTFFIYTILSKDFRFFGFDSYATRIINSISSISFFFILSIYKRKKTYTSSSFFVFVFSSLLPIMLFIFLSLAIIYFAKIIILYDSEIDFTDFNFIAPVLTFLIFLSMVMFQITKKREKVLKILFVFTIITSIAVVFFYLRYAKFAYAVHYLLIYILISIYFFIVLIKIKGITYLASYVISLIILIYFMPVLGYLNYKEFISKTNRCMITNNITAHNKQKGVRGELKKESEESIYYNAPELFNNARWIIKNEDYKDILIDINISIDKNNKQTEENFENANFIYEDYEFILNKDGKKLIVKNTTKGVIEEFDLYSRIKNSQTKKNELVEFKTENFKLIISRYSINKYTKGVNFNVYIYNNGR